MKKKEKVIKRAGCFLLAVVFAFGSLPQFVGGSVVFASDVSSSGQSADENDSTVLANDNTETNSNSASKNSSTALDGGNETQNAPGNENQKTDSEENKGDTKKGSENLDKTKEDGEGKDDSEKETEGENEGDTQGPEISIDKYKAATDSYYISDNEGYKTVDVSGKISDESGVKSIRVSKDNKEIASWNISNDVNNPTVSGKEISYFKDNGSFTIKGLDEAGTYQIVAEDNVATKNENEEGNKSEEKTFEIKKDSTAPLISNLQIKDTSSNNFISWAKNQILGTKNIEVKFTANDTESGIDKDSAFIRQTDTDGKSIDYKADSVTADGNNYTSDFTLKKGGDQKITFMIKDNVGNDSNGDVNGSATIDESAPKIKTTFSNNIIASDAEENNSNNIDVYFDAESKEDTTFTVNASDDFGLDTVTAKAGNEEKINAKVSDSECEIKKDYESTVQSFTFPEKEKTMTVTVQAADLVKDNTKYNHITTKTYTIHKITAKAKVENLKIDDKDIGNGRGDYSFFKNDSAKIVFNVTMNSDDGTKIPDGIKSISYSLNGKNGTSTGNLEINENEAYEISVNESFSGNLTITVVDRFNRTTTVNSDYFVIEKPDVHTFGRKD